jgi:hypothetical protein
VNRYEPRSLMLVCTEEAYCVQQVTRSDRAKHALSCITSMALSPNSYVAAYILVVPSQHQHLQSQERLFGRAIHQSLSHYEPPTPQRMWCWPGSDASPIQDQSSTQHGAYHLDLQFESPTSSSTFRVVEHAFICSMLCVLIDEQFTKHSSSMIFCSESSFHPNK